MLRDEPVDLYIRGVSDIIKKMVIYDGQKS